MNALNPNLMTADERLEEVARILVAGILRYRESIKKTSTSETISLDNMADQCPYGRKPADMERDHEF